MTHCANMRTAYCSECPIQPPDQQLFCKATNNDQRIDEFCHWPARITDKTHLPLSVGPARQCQLLTFNCCATSLPFLLCQPWLIAAVLFLVCVECRQGLDGRTGLLFSHAQVIDRLQIQPELRVGAEEMPQA